jgi:hypothetical protein
MTSYRQETDELSGGNFIILEPTCRLRWRNTFGLHENTLQQLWVDRFSGEEEWRDIPIE